MREIVYSAAASLDGYIARADGAVDWIPMDTDVDGGAMFSRFDTILMGRKTHEVSLAMGGAAFASMETYVFSRTHSAGRDDRAKYVTVSPSDLVKELRKQPGKDLCLMGGGELAAEFLKDDLIDGIQLALCPVVLGAGVPLFATGFPQRQFRLTGHRVYAKSGIVWLDYERV